jgi:hypothetical protein
MYFVGCRGRQFSDNRNRSSKKAALIAGGLFLCETRPNPLTSAVKAWLLVPINNFRTKKEKEKDMYKVLLDKGKLQIGRASINRIVASQIWEISVPIGSHELLQLLLSQAELNWMLYERISDVGMFGQAIGSITDLTLAAELITHMRGVMRKGYALQQGEVMTDEEQKIAAGGNSMLKLMWKVVNALQKQVPSKSASESEEKRLTARRKRLNYAEHVTNLALSVCQPEAFAYQHPDAEKWRTERARVKRNLAATLIESAKMDELAARKLQPNPAE